MSAGAIADSGLISRVGFTCDTGQAQYHVYCGFTLGASGVGSGALNETADTVTSTFRVANGMTVDITDQGSATGSNVTVGVATGIFDEHLTDITGFNRASIVVNLNIIGQGEPPSGDTESERKTSYWTTIKAINHTQGTVVDRTQIPASQNWTGLSGQGDAIAQGGNGAALNSAYRVMFEALHPNIGNGDGNSNDFFKWALNDEITFEFWGW